LAILAGNPTEGEVAEPPGPVASLGGPLLQVECAENECHSHKESPPAISSAEARQCRVNAVARSFIRVERQRRSQIGNRFLFAT
jgi:hypothetical protein